MVPINPSPIISMMPPISINFEDQIFNQIIDNN